MPLPFSFILGLFCIISAEDLTHSLPRDPDPSRLYPYLVLVTLPWLLARFALRASGRARPRTGGRLAVAAFRLPGLALGLLPIPAVCWVLLGPGDLHNLVESWTGGSALLQFLGLLVPLILLEISAEVGRKQAARVMGPRAGYETQPLRGRMIGFLAIPPLLFFAACCGSLAARCCSLLLLAPALRCSQLLVAARCCPLLLAAALCSSLLLCAARCCSLLLVAARCCSLLLAAARCYCSLLSSAPPCCSLVLLLLVAALCCSHLLGVARS